MKRNWSAITILSICLSADALVVVSLLWAILKAGGTGQAVGIAACLMALIPYPFQRLSPRIGSLLARDPARVFSATRIAGLALSIACALIPPAHLSLGALYAVSGAYALLTFLTGQALETMISYRVMERALTPNLASRMLQTSVQVGAFLGAGLAGFIIEWGGFRAVAVALAAIYVFGALAVQAVHSLNDSQPTSTGSALPGAALEASSAWSSFLMIGLVLVNGWAFSVLIPYISGIERGWSASDYGVIAAAAGVGGLAAALILGHRLRWLTWLGFTGLAAADLWLAAAPTVAGAAIAAALCGFFANLIRVRQSEALLAATSSSEQAARWAAHLSMISFLTRALTPLALAFWLDRVGGTLAFQILALALIAIGCSLQFGQILTAQFHPSRRRPVVAIVDAYSTAALIAPEFKARGYDCVHVMSSTELSPIFYTSLKDDDFIDHILHQGDVAQTVEDLRRHRVKQVIVGSEPGVELADALSERMGLLTNGTARSRARRHKFDQIEAVRAHGLKCANQALVATIEGALAFAARQGEWPLVVKPVASSGTDSVHVCRDEAALKTAAEDLLGRRNRYGRFNDEILIQSFLRGEEYVVDTLSIESNHRITGVWLYEKVSIDGASFIYRSVTLLDPTTDTAQTLSAYAREVLKALSIQHGPTHQEIMWTADGPALVECNARICGAEMPRLWEHCTGLSLPGMIAEAYVARKRFLKRPDPIGKLERRGKIICLASNVDHCILDPHALNALRALESFREIKLMKKAEDVYPRTRDLFTLIGHVHLVHGDLTVIARDEATIRHLEASGLYVEVSAPREQDGHSLMRRPQLVRVKAPVEQRIEAERI